MIDIGAASIMGAAAGSTSDCFAPTASDCGAGSEVAENPVENVRSVIGRDAGLACAEVSAALVAVGSDTVVVDCNAKIDVAAGVSEVELSATAAATAGLAVSALTDEKPDTDC
ncbi:hypothetical protein [Rhizobium sp. RAF56]|uniref:hypothetical protein n=1 Tax=Rhizobium sp. RAF56 TaxID=3233062 RepID=UPI003F95679F